jgi:EmrB/QacA subfamily drug resistance transporter
MMNAKSKSGKGGLFIIILSGLMITLLNQTVINVALPQIMSRLQIGAATAQWLSSGYMLAVGILIPVSAYLAKRFTYRQLFITAIALFTVGSLVCAVSLNFSVLLAGRLLQAAAGGILMPLAMNIFMLVFPLEKRGAVMGILGLGMVLAPAIGPTAGGYVIQYYNLDALFYAMAILAACILLASFFLFKFKNECAKVKLDMVGTVTSTIGFGFLLYGISEVGTYGWGDLKVTACLAIAVIALTVFVLYELKKENPLLQMRVFRNFNFSYTTIVNMILNIALYGGMLLLPIYLQTVRELTPLDSGLLLLPGSLIMGIMGVFTGKLFDKFGIKPLALAGITIMSITTYMYSKLSMGTSHAEIMILYIIRSFGMSFVMMPINSAGLMTIKPELIPHATALQNTLKQIAGSVGTAVLIVIMSAESRGYMANLGATVKPDSALPATLHGINVAFFAAALISGVALFLSLFFKSTKSTPQKVNISEKPQAD